MSLVARWGGDFEEGKETRWAAQGFCSVTHMIPLFWAIGVQDRADRV